MGRCRVAAAMLALCACKAELGNDPTQDPQYGVDAQTGMQSDAGSDGTPIVPWSTPTKVLGASTTADEDDPTMSSNLLELYFKRADTNDTNLYVMTRASTTSAWGAPTALGVLNTGQNEESPRLSTDDLKLYFARGGDIYVSTRSAVGQPWGTAVAVNTLNTAQTDKWAAVCSNGYVVLSRFTTNNGQDLYDGTLAGGANTLIPVINSATNDQGTFLSDDCLTLYFQSNRTNNQFDIYVSTRVATNGPWSQPTVLTVFNTPTYSEEDAWVSHDQKTFVFASNASGNKDVYISTR